MTLDLKSTKFFFVCDKFCFFYHNFNFLIFKFLIYIFLFNFGRNFTIANPCIYWLKLKLSRAKLNRKQYPGVVERNMTYSFKIYYEHFNRGNEYSEFKKYNLIQVNFNKFKNPNNKSINKYYLLDANDSKNFLSKSICIINIDIEECYNLVYNNTCKEEISELEKLAAILYCDYLEDISSILESVRLDNMEKEKFINDINNVSKDKNNQEAIKLEDNIEYRFELTEEEALNKGIKQGIAQNTINTIKNLLKKNYDIKEIASITNKSIEEIKEIEKSIKD